jgi:HSP20 family molecular chaperone IbpA
MTCIWKESVSGEFFASAGLPEWVDASSIAAAYTGGMLRIVAPTYAWACSPRIPIGASGVRPEPTLRS